VDVEHPGHVIDVTKGARSEHPASWSSTRKTLLYTYNDPSSGYDLWYRSLGLAGSFLQAKPFVVRRGLQRQAQWSPDDRNVAYSSSEGSAPFVFIKPFEGGSEVEVGRGSRPRWTSYGSELVFLRGSQLISVAVDSTEDQLTVGPEKDLFKLRAPRGPGAYDFDVTLDGSRFLVIESVLENDEPVKITVHRELPI